MSVRLGHQVHRNFFFSSSRFLIFKFIALINDLNKQTATSKSSALRHQLFTNLIVRLLSSFSPLIYQFSQNHQRIFEISFRIFHSLRFYELSNTSNSALSNETFKPVLKSFIFRTFKSLEFTLF